MNNNVWIDLNIYNSKKVLVTGHTGFKGSWLSVWLTELGAKVIGYSLEPPTEPSFFKATNLENKIIHTIGDVRDEKHLLSVFEKYQPEFVFHLAAQSLVRFSYEEPKLTYETNIMGTVNVLEAVRNTESVRACVIVTSDKCYENKEWIYGYRENDPMGGYDPYSSSKGCAELVTAAYRRSFFNSKEYSKIRNAGLASVRAGNIIGGGDWREDRLIPDCVSSLSQNKTILIRNPDAIRPWQYVLEALSGYLLLGSKMYQNGVRFAGAWNFGPPDSDIITVEEIVKKMLSYWGNGDYEVETSPEKPHEAKLLKLDCSKAHSILKWHSVYNIDEALKKTTKWYKKYYNGVRGKELYKFTIEQIKEYMKRGDYCVGN
ncbi:CDP-glucose 4,6-dehydratase [Patescibacteria group bacterium]|nr:CDP-glucose 4,6-dehydratase [Patescibacteria group bacterium]